jgi:hypothetical protein
MAATRAISLRTQRQTGGLRALPLGLAVLMAAIPWAALAAGEAGKPLYRVSSRAELLAAIAAAGPGDTIRLKAGDYGDVSLRNRRYAGKRLTLVGDTADRPVLASLDLRQAAGVAVAGVRISGATSPLVNMSGASDIVFAGNEVTGSNRNQDPWDDGSAGIHARTAQRVTIAQNLFEDIRVAAYVQRSSGVTIARNTARHVREGLNLAAVSNLDIVGNLFHSFSPLYPKKEHPDAIQFWTSGETEGSSDVRIANNVMLLGGCKAVQGIFVRSETGEGLPNHVRHRNFTVSGNVYYGSSRHGITLSGIDGATVDNNVVVSTPFSEAGRVGAAATDPRCSGAMVPVLRTTKAMTDHSLSRNIVMHIDKTEARQADNIVVGSGRGANWTDLFAARPTADTPALEEFVTRTPSKARSRGIGLLATFPHGASGAGSAALAEALRMHKP